MSKRINWRAVYLMFVNMLIMYVAVELSTGLMSGKYTLTTLVASAIMSVGILSAALMLKYFVVSWASIAYALYLECVGK